MLAAGTIMRTMLSMSGSPADREPSPAVRVPPRVIRVPPPKVAVVPFLALPLVLWAGLLTLLGLYRAPAWAKPFWYGGLLMAAVAGPVGECRHRLRLNKRRREWLERHPTWDADHTAVRLDGLWFFLSQPPSAKAIRNMLQEAPPEHGHAVVVCLGAFDVPQQGDYRFEPEVLSSGQTDRMDSLVVAALAFLVVFAVGACLEALGRVPRRADEYWFAMAAVASIGAYLLWRYALRPTYVRVAPGVAEVLTYSLLRSAPRIRRYTVAPDLLCIVSQGWSRTSVTLINSRNRDEFRITARRSAVFVDTLFRALVSTAPTPPLSREELVG